MRCEMCGKESKLFTAIVEGVELQTCQTCSHHGRVLRRPKKIRKLSKSAPVESQPEVVERIVSDYGACIRSAREKKGLSHKELARQLAEKESLLHKLETQKVPLSLELARKFEKLLHLQLIEKYKEKPVSLESSRNQAFTIADIIKNR